ncbi:MAG: hypothetical protein U0Y68_03685 [Blastocatellia bacterium]
MSALNAKLKKVSLSLPFGIGSAEWEVNTVERKAAWELYIELVTRIAVQSLDTEQGLVREAMNSLYTLFGSTRDILRKAGPDIGIANNSVGGIAIAVLNNGLRPFLAKWHPWLQSYEAKREPKVSPQEHEKKWKHEKEVREELETLRRDLTAYAEALATIAGVKR